MQRPADLITIAMEALGHCHAHAIMQIPARAVYRYRNISHFVRQSESPKNILKS